MTDVTNPAQPNIDAEKNMYVAVSIAGCVLGIILGLVVGIVATVLLIRVSVDTLYRDGANDVSRERIQTAPLAHPGRAS